MDSLQISWRRKQECTTFQCKRRLWQLGHTKITWTIRTPTCQASTVPMTSRIVQRASIAFSEAVVVISQTTKATTRSLQGADLVSHTTRRASKSLDRRTGAPDWYLRVTHAPWSTLSLIAILSSVLLTMLVALAFATIVKSRSFFSCMHKQTKQLRSSTQKKTS